MRDFWSPKGGGLIRGKGEATFFGKGGGTGCSRSQGRKGEKSPRREAVVHIGGFFGQRKRGTPNVLKKGRRRAFLTMREKREEMTKEKKAVFSS